MSQTQSGFNKIIVIVLGLVVIIGTSGWYVWSRQNPVASDEIKFSGKITADDCTRSGAPPIGDVGCSVTVNGYAIDVVPGNIRPPANPDGVTGLDLHSDQTGEVADVYAKKLDNNSASILDDVKYYVHIHDTGSGKKVYYP